MRIPIPNLIRTPQAPPLATYNGENLGKNDGNIFSQLNTVVGRTRNFLLKSRPSQKEVQDCIDNLKKLYNQFTSIGIDKNEKSIIQQTLIAFLKKAEELSDLKFNHKEELSQKQVNDLNNSERSVSENLSKYLDVNLSGRAA